MNEVIEKREWSQWDEDTKAEYVIKIMSFSVEFNRITRLRLSKKCELSKINHDIDYNGGEISVTLSEEKNNYRLIIGNTTVTTWNIKVDPWFTSIYEINYLANTIGVKRTYRLILECIKALTNNYFDW
jgi:phosphotransferase system IIB component